MLFGLFACIFQNQINVFFDTCILQTYFLIIKVINFWVDLSYISAKMATLSVTYGICVVYRTFRKVSYSAYGTLRHVQYTYIMRVRLCLYRRPAILIIALCVFTDISLALVSIEASDML